MQTTSLCLSTFRLVSCYLLILINAISESVCMWLCVVFFNDDLRGKVTAQQQKPQTFRYKVKSNESWAQNFFSALPEFTMQDKSVVKDSEDGLNGISNYLEIWMTSLWETYFKFTKLDQKLTNPTEGGHLHVNVKISVCFGLFLVFPVYFLSCVIFLLTPRHDHTCPVLVW